MLFNEKLSDTPLGHQAWIVECMSAIGHVEKKIALLAALADETLRCTPDESRNLPSASLTISSP